MISNSYCQEIRGLKEELSNCNSEKLRCIKRIQELEGQMKLHKTFQDSIAEQMTEIRKKSSALALECQTLKKEQENVEENVSSTKAILSKYDQLNQHLKQAMEVVREKNDNLKQELIASRSEATLLKSKTINVKNIGQTKSSKSAEDKIDDVEKLLRSSQKEKERLLKNLKDNCSLLNKHITKLAEADETVKKLQLQIASYEEQNVSLIQSLNDLQKEVNCLKQKERTKKEQAQLPDSSSESALIIETAERPTDDTDIATTYDEEAAMTPKPLTTSTKRKLEDVIDVTNDIEVKRSHGCSDTVKEKKSRGCPDDIEAIRKSGCQNSNEDKQDRGYVGVVEAKRRCQEDIAANRSHGCPNDTKEKRSYDYLENIETKRNQDWPVDIEVNQSLRCLENLEANKSYGCLEDIEAKSHRCLEDIEANRSHGCLEDIEANGSHGYPDNDDLVMMSQESLKVTQEICMSQVASDLNGLKVEDHKIIAEDI